MKRLLSTIVTLVAGGVVLADYFLKSDLLSGISGRFLAWSVLISSFATALGGANILTVHARSVKARRKGWGLSAVLIFSLVTWFGIGVSRGTCLPYTSSYGRTYTAAYRPRCSP